MSTTVKIVTQESKKSNPQFLVRQEDGNMEGRGRGVHKLFMEFRGIFTMLSLHFQTDGYNKNCKEEMPMK